MASILNVDKIRRQAGGTDAIVIDSGDRITTPTRPTFTLDMRILMEQVDKMFLTQKIFDM